MRTIVKVFCGECDLAYKSILGAELDSVRDEPNVVLDMRGITYLDSTCATELLRLHEYRAQNGHPQVSIVRSGLVVRRVFAILYFKTLFRLFDTLGEALPKDGSTVVIQPAFHAGDAPAAFPPWGALAPSLMIGALSFDPGACAELRREQGRGRG
jgi:anti-anti-sigma regulatory factor